MAFYTYFALIYPLFPCHSPVFLCPYIPIPFISSRGSPSAFMSYIFHNEDAPTGIYLIAWYPVGGTVGDGLGAVAGVTLGLSTEVSKATPFSVSSLCLMLVDQM